MEIEELIYYLTIFLSAIMIGVYLVRIIVSISNTFLVASQDMRPHGHLESPQVRFQIISTTCIDYYWIKLNGFNIF